MIDYIQFRKSISHELIAIKDRVRSFIDNRHWGEEGRYKEVVLLKTLRNYLPNNVGIGTGLDWLH